MTRVKRGIISAKRRRKILRQVRGFRWGRKSKERLAREALLHAGDHAWKDRRKKKRVARYLWQAKINAAARLEGMPYSRFIAGIKREKIGLDRKMLANLAENHPEVFRKIVAEVKPR